jgi:serine phosphatase RsbU (regulator of sigma subunit)/tetratricopeptide (TPR) repeat protein
MKKQMLTFKPLRIIRRTGTIFCFVFLFVSMHAQIDINDADSLKKVLGSTRDEHAQGEVLLKIGQKLSEIKPAESIGYLDKAIVIGDKYKDTSILVYAYISKGIACDNLGKMAEAFTAYEKALPMAEKLGNKLLIASVYGNVGMLYQHASGDTAKALENFRKSIQIHEELQDKELGEVYNNVGIVFLDRGDYDSALVYFNKSMKESEKRGDERMVSYIYNNIGNIYFQKKDYPTSISYFEKSKVIKEKLGDKKGMVSAYANIGEAYGEMGQYDAAIENLNIGLALAFTVHNKLYLREVYRALSVVYLKKKDYQNAYTALELYNAYKDSIFGAQKLDQVLNLQKKYETVQKEKENEFLRQANEIAEESIRRKDILNYAIAGCLVLVLGGAFFIFNAYSQKKKANLEISVQKAALEVKNKEVFDSITYAKRIQYTLLANKTLLEENLRELFILFRPKDIVSGDFYWATENEEYFYLAVCDSTGHGVPGAFMSLLNISFLNEAINEKKISSPDEILNYVRARLVESVSKEGAQDGMDATLLRFRKIKTGTAIDYAAAHNAPVLVKKNEIATLSADKMPVGLGSSQAPFKLHRLAAETGDMIYLFTDGYVDQFGGEKGKKFKYKRLMEKLLGIHQLPVTAQEKNLEQTFLDWKGNLEQVDDVCVIGIRIG